MGKRLSLSKLSAGKRPDEIMNDEKFKQLAPWNEEVKAEIKHRTANLKK